MNGQPIILEEGSYSPQDLANLKKQRIWEEHDLYVDQVKELLEIQKKKSTDGPGTWVYFPWSGILIHMVNRKNYELLRTNRNRNLITEDEQARLKTFCVGIAGLSVGNSIATTLAYQGFGTFKLADFDTVSTSNLNRLRAGLPGVAISKIDVTMRNIYEIDPWANLEVFSSGLTKKVEKDFFQSSPLPKVIIDEMDDFEMKIQIRHTARAAQIPVLMFTNLGDTILIDVERYDLDSTLQPFHGLSEERQRNAIDIVGKENIPPRALASALEVGKTLVGRPQLVSTITASGGIATYALRKLALGESLTSGRSKLNLNELL